MSTLTAVYHRPKSEFCYAVSSTSIVLRVRSAKDEVHSIICRYGDKYLRKNNTPCFETVDLSFDANDSLFDYFSCIVSPSYKRLAYDFIIFFKNGLIYLYCESDFEKLEQSTINVTQNDIDKMFQYPYLHAVDVFTPPCYTRDLIFYQIFIDRFCKGQSAIPAPPTLKPWGSMPEGETDLYGGNLAGICSKINYLHDLGITALYLTPIFESRSNHKYNTINYRVIDPVFGTEQEMKNLVSLAHSKRMKVVIDLVFNHCGDLFDRFVQVSKALNEGKAKGIQTPGKVPYMDWFHITVRTDGSWDYEKWSFVSTLPKLNTSNPEVKEHLFDATRYYLEVLGVDGFRLDVANEVDHCFWREFKAFVRKLNPSAYILGEIWHQASPWLDGSQFDAVMAYEVRRAVIDYILSPESKMDAQTFKNQLVKWRYSYPLIVSDIAFTLLGSHDTQRVLTMAQGQDGKEYAQRRAEAAMVFLFCFVGTPCLYYGDELALEGGNDPDCRRCIEWELLDSNTSLPFVKDLIRLRHNNTALKIGELSFLRSETGERVVVFTRHHGNSSCVVMINSSKEFVSVSRDLVDGKRHKCLHDRDFVSYLEDDINLEPFGHAIFC
ncbi:hypothetical protein P9112_004374 [Eukaryota sp. TZLM1-RC]